MEAVKYLREAAGEAEAYNLGGFGLASIEARPMGVVVNARRGPRQAQRVVSYDVLACCLVNPLTHALAEVAEAVGLKKPPQEEPS